MASPPASSLLSSPSALCPFPSFVGPLPFANLGREFLARPTQPKAVRLPNSDSRLAFGRFPERRIQCDTKKQLLIPRALNDSESSSPPSSRLTAVSSEPDPKEIKNAFDVLSDVFSSLDDDFFVKLPNDLKVDLRDAGFVLSSGPLSDQFGEAQGENLRILGGSLENGNGRLAQKALAALSSGVFELPPGSASRAALGKRFISAGKKFLSMGNFAGGKLSNIGEQFERIGKEISKGCDENSPSLFPSSPTKVFKFGELQVEITREKAFYGFVIAVFFDIVNWTLTTGISGVDSSGLQYANENANLLAKSLLDALLLAGYGTTALTTFAALGLLSLAIGWKEE